jgi:hypothetical protein
MDLSGDYAEKNADVLKVGTDHGVACLDEAKRYVKQQDAGRRVLYFSALLRVVVECMRASIGRDASLAVLDTAREYVQLPRDGDRRAAPEGGTNTNTPRGP